MSEKSLQHSSFGRLILELQAKSKAINILVKNLEKCYVVSLDSNECVIDPFLAQTVLEKVGTSDVSDGINSRVIHEIQDSILSECKRVADGFEARLRSFCSVNGIHLDGRYPSYLLQGFLSLQISRNEGKCRIGNNEVRSLLLESLAPIILNDIDSDKKRPWDKAQFIEELYSAYVRVIALKQLNIGSPVPIQDVFIELVFIKQPSQFRNQPTRHNFSEYDKELFQRDISKLIQLGSNITKDGMRLELMPTSFVKEAMPALVSGSIRYVGRISFSGNR